MTAAALPPLPGLLPARRGGAMLLVLAVLCGHAALLVGGPAPRQLPGAGPVRESVRPVQVRRIATAAPAATVERPADAAPAAVPGLRRADAGPLPQARPTRQPTARPPLTSAPAPIAAPAAGATAAPATAERREPPHSLAAIEADAFDAPAAETAAAPDPGGVAIPVYATRLPPATTLRYALQRGAVSGEAELHWQPAEGRYELTWSGPAFAAQRRAWVSRGGVDADGIAPERFAETRRGRELRAVNFQRDSGRITFSGPRHEFALVPGAQDRLSWMLQLAAIVAADPALQTPGARVTMFVAGARGGADPWEFAAVAQEAVAIPAGAAGQTLRWRREAARTWDTEVDVWLDPARHHLPVRARLRTPGGGAASEFTLLQMTAP